MLIQLFVLSIFFGSTNGQALNLTEVCSPSKGYCGPAAVCGAYVSPLPGCVFTQKTLPDYNNAVQKKTCKQCTPSTDARCSRSALSAVIKGPGIKAAYCNNEFLVIHTDMTSNFGHTLTKVPNPPGATDSSGASCVTRSVDLGGFTVVKIPLTTTPLSTDTNMNNVNANAFPSGGGFGSANLNGEYMSKNGVVYGLPTRGSIGISVGGQDIFPAFNNNGVMGTDICEMDACQQHVGGGGGTPHLHGDPWGPHCLYSSLNYASSGVHPPQIGWAFDGYSIYGRHINAANAGYEVALDGCGGHTHGSYGYHYHTQMLNVVTSSAVLGGKTNSALIGLPYTTSTPGVYKCFKGDISLIKNFWGDPSGVNAISSFVKESPDTTEQPCCSTTYDQAYTATGISLATTSGSSTGGTGGSTPTYRPTGGNGPTPGNAPTYSSGATKKPTGRPVTVRAVQKLNGVTKATADTVAFQTAFKATVAKVTACNASAVVINSVKDTSTRRVRTLLGAAVTLDYSVTKTDPSSTASTDMTNSLTNAGTTLTSDLGQYGATAVTTVTTEDVSPTSAPTPTSAPVVVSSGSGSGSGSGSSSSSNNGCFAGSEQVTLESGTVKSVADVRVGDRVLSVNRLGVAVYSDVVYLPHGANNHPATFTAISTVSGRDVKMTSNHMLPVGACALQAALPMRAASQIAVGDCVQTVSGREEVISVNKVQGQGIYTIVAMEELIVVNGIVATPFGGVNPTLANIYYNLHRLVYTSKRNTMFGAVEWVQMGMAYLYDAATAAKVAA